MDLLEQSAAMERIELLAKLACFEDSSSREKLVALVWISEIAEEGKRGVIFEMNKPPAKGGFESGGGNNLQ